VWRELRAPPRRRRLGRAPPAMLVERLKAAQAALTPRLHEPAEMDDGSARQRRCPEEFRSPKLSRYEPATT
jgi:hypothetical protein